MAPPTRSALVVLLPVAAGARGGAVDCPGWSGGNVALIVGALGVLGVAVT